MCAPRVLLLPSLWLVWNATNVAIATDAAGASAVTAASATAATAGATAASASAAAPAAAAGGGCRSDDHCCQLRELSWSVLREAAATCADRQEFSDEARVVVDGRAGRFELARGGGVAAAAARALLRALLRHALRYSSDSVALASRRVHAFCAENPPNMTRNVFTVSIATSWRGERCAAAPGALPPGLRGRRAQEVGAGAAPAARRLLAHVAAAAPAHCAAGDWAALADDACLFRSAARVYGAASPSNWPNCTCLEENAKCVTVLAVEEEEDEGPLAPLLRQLCARAGAGAVPPLRLAALPRDAALRAALAAGRHSFLFLDYDLWTDAAPETRVRPAPPLPCSGGACDALDNATSLLVADTGLLMQYAPRALSLIYNFRPAPAVIRSVLDSSEGPEQAACKAAVDHRDALRDWLHYCEPSRIVLVVWCRDHNFEDTYHKKVINTVGDYWRQDENRMHFNLLFYGDTIMCNDTGAANSMLKVYVNKWNWTRTAGLVVQSAAGAETLGRSARAHGVPLLLAQAPPAAAARPRPRAAAPAARHVARALRSLLRRCGWRRVALLRENTASDIWDLLLASEALVTHEQELDARRPGDALDALWALDARVVVLEAGAAVAERVLAEAAARGAAASRVWLVLGAAGADWLPPPGFAYVSLSGAWRGGAARALRGSAALRARLDAALGGRWPPRAAPLADALLLAMTGIDRSLKIKPHFLNDLHSSNYSRLFFDILDNTTVEGVTHTFGRRESPFIFVHRWNASGCQLLAAWPAGERAGRQAPQLCAAVADAAACYTATSGRDAFAPNCLDVAIAIALCALALAPPALCAAAAARRARLRLRDRALEARLQARGGRSAVAAAAAAALAGRTVPRAAVELLDQLGEGTYGTVWLAMLRMPGTMPVAVAAKAPRADVSDDAEGELLREAALLSTLRHNHVVRFTAVCFDGAPLVLMENAFYGDLCSYLRARRPPAERARAGAAEPEAAHVAAPALTRLAREAAAALAYLAHCRLVHRDVRAANCLVDERRALKLADFGLARRTDEPGATNGEYLMRRRALVPVLWMAPESLAGGVFSAASDVWALGVLLLELVTLGARPYGRWAAPRVVQHVRAGGRPLVPRAAAPSTRGVAAACWRRAPEQRPAAAELVAWLAAHPRALQPALPAAAPRDAPGDAPGDHFLDFDQWTD